MMAGAHALGECGVIGLAPDLMMALGRRGAYVECFA